MKDKLHAHQVFISEQVKFSVVFPVDSVKTCPELKRIGIVEREHRQVSGCV